MRAKVTPLQPLVTRLRPSNRKAVSEHFLRLDTTTLRARFGNTVNSKFVDEYAKRVFELDGVVYGIFLDRKLRAVAELRELLNDWPVTVEAAFSVESDWQNRGLGNILMTHVATTAQKLGTKSINMMCSRDNERMKHIARKQKSLMELANNDVSLNLEFC